MSRYRLRVELPDLPGALAKVATVISDLDGDVVSIDIHELDGHQAVDELVVEVLTELDGRVLADRARDGRRRCPALVRPGDGAGGAGARRARLGPGDRGGARTPAPSDGSSPPRAIRPRCGWRRSTRRVRSPPDGWRWPAARRSCSDHTICPLHSADGPRRRCGCSRCRTVSRTPAASRSSPGPDRCASPRRRSRVSTRSWRCTARSPTAAPSASIPPRAGSRARPRAAGRAARGARPRPSTDGTTRSGRRRTRRRSRRGIDTRRPVGSITVSSSISSRPECVSVTTHSTQARSPTTSNGETSRSMSENAPSRSSNSTASSAADDTDDRGRPTLARRRCRGRR